MSSTDQQSKTNDSLIFVGFFLLGAIPICVIKWLFPAYPFATIIPPLLIMGLYFLHLIKYYPSANRPERTGDNIYYMGFLFTLVSLGLALYEFSNTPSRGNDLLSDFAIALLTTGLGVLGRVSLTQGDDKDIEGPDITSTIDQFKSDLNRACESMAEFATTTRQILEENRQEQVEQLRKDREEFKRHFTKSLEEMGQVFASAIHEGGRKINAELERLGTSIASEADALSERVSVLNSASDNLTASLNRTMETLDSMPDPEVFMNEKINKIVAPIEKATERMVNILDKQVGWAEQSATTVTKITTTLETLEGSIKEVADSSASSLAKIQAPVEQIVERLSGIHASLTKINQQIGGIPALSETVGQFSQQLAQSVNGVQAFDREVEDLKNRLLATLTALNESLGKTRATQVAVIEQDTEKLSRLAEDRDQLVGNLSESSRQIEECVNTLSTRIEEMSVALLEAARFIRK